MPMPAAATEIDAFPVRVSPERPAATGATVRPERPARPAPDAPCAHCGLPVGHAMIAGSAQTDGSNGDSDASGGQTDRWFCCTGCAVVYDALASAGLGEYHRLRALDPDAARPARTVRLSDAVAELDTARFLADETAPGPAGTRRVTLALDGVHCAACVWLVERLPHDVAGVREARLDLARGRVAITFAPAEVRLSDVARRLARFGYEARPLRRDASGARPAAERRLLVRMGAAWALAGNAMLLAFALYSGLDVAVDNGLADAGLAHGARLVSGVLATISMFVAGPEFFRRAWASVRHAVAARSIARLHMDTPIALGVLGGYAYSVWAALTGRGDVWFDSLLVLMAALLTARFLQLRARRLAGDASERLLALVPTMARRVGADGAVDVVEAALLAAGDCVEVRPGEVVPVDGIVASGASHLDRSVLTGESQPDEAAPGAHVEAGTTNLTHRIVVRVEACGEATRVGRLLAHVRDGRPSSAATVLLADRIAGVFVAGVIALAVLAAVLWAPHGADVAARVVVAVLVIACPCALGMATPLAFAVAAGRAARAGLFVKQEDAFERLAGADVVVFDKTGTLTEGRPSVVSVVGRSGLDDTAARDALRLAAALDRDSLHPVATALVAACADAAVSLDTAAPLDGASTDGLSIMDARIEAICDTPGAGRSGIVEGHRVVVGRPSWAMAQATAPDAALAAAAEALAADGLTPVLVVVDGEAVAAIGVGDALRADAAALVARLRREGRRPYLLSGDHPAVAARVGAALGIDADSIEGGASPEHKRATIARLAETGTVVMIGDGVNDAAAMQAAHVGVAVGGGAAASQVAADVFAVRPGLAPVVALFDGSRAVVQTVRRGLAVSLAYNLLGALAAVAGLVTPLVAAVAMPVSSLAVVALALSQRSFRAADRRRPRATAAGRP